MDDASSQHAFLQALAQVRFTRGPSLGAGEDLRLEDPAVGGGALVSEELVHLTGSPRRNSQGLARPTGADPTL